MSDLKPPLLVKALSPRGISGTGGWDARGGRGNSEWLSLREIRSVLPGDYCLFSENVRFKSYMPFIFELCIERKVLLWFL